MKKMTKKQENLLGSSARETASMAFDFLKRKGVSMKPGVDSASMHSAYIRVRNPEELDYVFEELVNYLRDLGFRGGVSWDQDRNSNTIYFTEPGWAESSEMKEKMDPKDFYDFPKSVRDAAEKIYDLFERDTINNILKGKEKPSMWRSITSTLSPKEAEQATELAFAWAAEDSMSSSKFPESKEKNMKTITIKEEMRIPGTDIILEEGDRIKVLEASYNYLKQYKKMF